MDPEPFLRGVLWTGSDRVPYPRAKPDDIARLPVDTWEQAKVPAGVRIEFTGAAAAVEIAYVGTTDRLGFRGEGAGVTFQLWQAGSLVSEERAVVGESRVRLKLGEPATAERAVVYLPEGMRPRVTDVGGVDGEIAPAPPQPRWIAYGDSIAEGWSASSPALGWVHIAGREQGLDAANMGYAGAARGEIVSAEQIAGLEAGVVSISHGTNCWNRIPHSAAMVRAGLEAFLDVVRQGHPHTPVLVVSPVLRPEAESTPNRLGATLADLREAMEDVVRSRADERLVLVPGRDLIEESMLADETHPNDAGHRALADALGPAIRSLVEGG